MKCPHLTTKAVYKNKVLQGYECINCKEFLEKTKVFPHLKKRLDYLELNDDRLDEDERQDRIKEIQARLNYLRQEIEAERISTQEIAELQSLAEHIDKGDTLLLQWAGVDEFKD